MIYFLRKLAASTYPLDRHHHPHDPLKKLLTYQTIPDRCNSHHLTIEERNISAWVQDRSIELWLTSSSSLILALVSDQKLPEDRSAGGGRSLVSLKFRHLPRDSDRPRSVEKRMSWAHKSRLRASPSHDAVEFVVDAISSSYFPSVLEWCSRRGVSSLKHPFRLRGVQMCQHTPVPRAD